MYADVPTVTMDTEDTESIEEPIREPICADCRYSQVLAVQPRWKLCGKLAISYQSPV